MRIFLAQPRGFCAGVTRAIDIVERALARHGAPVYVLHQIVHNHWVVDDLRARGAVFVDTLDQVPAGSPLVFSAHGVSRQVVAQAQQMRLQTDDATCPLVHKVHQQAQRFVRLGRTLLMIGHAGHEEVAGTLGQVDAPVHLIGHLDDVRALALPANTPLAYVTQTTLSLDDTRDIIEALHRRFTHIVGPEVDDICYATQNRQVAVRALATMVDLVLVVGAHNSSNANRLREVVERSGVPAHLIRDARDIQRGWLRAVSPVGALRVGVSAGASTPEVLVQGVVQALQRWQTGAVVQLPGVQEDTRFRLPDKPPLVAH